MFFFINKIDFVCFVFVLGLQKSASKKKKEKIQSESSSDTEADTNIILSAQEDKIEKEKLQALYGFAEKRATPLTDYNENSRCPFPGCDSQGKILVL